MFGAFMLLSTTYPGTTALLGYKQDVE